LERGLGANTFQVHAIVRVANLDPTPATTSFVWDSISPKMTITSGPKSETTKHHATWGIEGMVTLIAFDRDLAEQQEGIPGGEAHRIVLREPLEI
jgi:hypothetical protein